MPFGVVVAYDALNVLDMVRFHKGHLRKKIMSEKLHIFMFQNDRNCVIVEDSHGAIDQNWMARIRDHVGLGSGDTPEEAALAVAESLRRVADDIESSVAQK